MIAVLAAAAAHASDAGFPLLTALILVPAVGAVLTLLLPGRRPELIRARRLRHERGDVRPRGVPADPVRHRARRATSSCRDHSWMPALGIRWTLGVDGISLFMVALTTLLIPISLLASAELEKPKSFTFWMLLLEASVIGVFLALDSIVFFVFFELVLVPMYFLIAGWGHGNRRYAAVKFFLYTATGSAFLFVGILSVAFLHQHATGHLTFDVRDAHRVGVVVALAVARHREVAVRRVRDRLRGEGPAGPVPHVAARRAHRRAHRGLGRAGRRAAQDGHVRLPAVRDPDVPAGRGRPRADPARARGDRHHLRRDRRRDAAEPEADHRVLVDRAPRLRRARHVRAHEPGHLGRAVHDALARAHHRCAVPARRHALRPPPHVRAHRVPRAVEGGAGVRRPVRRRDVRVDRAARLLGLRRRVPRRCSARSSRAAGTRWSRPRA